MIEDAYVFYALCWIYSHPLVTGWAPTPLWCIFPRRRNL